MEGERDREREREYHGEIDIGEGKEIEDKGREKLVARDKTM